MTPRRSLARRLALPLVLACAVAVASGASPAAGRRAQGDDTRPPFTDWLSGVRAEALERGVRPGTLDAAFADLEPVEQVQQRDRNQAEFVLSFDRYARRWLNASFVRLGRRQKTSHATLLAQVGKRYGVVTARCCSPCGAWSRTTAGSLASGR